MKTVKDYLELDGGIILNIAIYNRFGGNQAYTEICGGFIEGVYQWATHNIDGIDECENSKNYGFTINFEDGRIRRIYIPIWVMNIEPKDFKHAKSLFNKYIKEDYKYNLSTEANRVHQY
jgi:hypothetical protein